MRRHMYRSSWSSLFASKRIVVALCAAIAMVLGAMSVGAYNPKPADPAGEYPLPAANQSTIVSQSVGEPQQPSQQIENGFAARRQSVPLAPEEQLDKQPSINNAQLPGLSLSVNVGPVEASIVVSPTQVPVLGNETEVIPVIPAEPTPTPAEGQQPLQGDTPASTSNSKPTTFIAPESPAGAVVQ